MPIGHERRIHRARANRFELNERLLFVLSKDLHWISP
jgi:hypothetical protein